MLYYLTKEDEEFFSPLLKNAEKNAPLEYIYRYVPFDSLLQSNKEREKLFMCNVQEWYDPYERKLLNATFSQKGKRSIPYPLKGRVYGTCFTQQYCCEAQWRYYGSDRHIALVSINLRKLLNQLQAAKTDFYIGKVRYYDQLTINQEINKAIASQADACIEWLKGIHSPQNCIAWLSPLLIKRKAFAYENEIRILTIEEHTHESVSKNLFADISNFIDLISNVVISPIGSDEWKLFQKEKLKKNNFTVEQIRISSLYKEAKKPLKIKLSLS